MSSSFKQRRSRPLYPPVRPCHSRAPLLDRLPRLSVQSTVPNGPCHRKLHVHGSITLGGLYGLYSTVRRRCAGASNPGANRRHVHAPLSLVSLYGSPVDLAISPLDVVRLTNRRKMGIDLGFGATGSVCPRRPPARSRDVRRLPALLQCMESCTSIARTVEAASSAPFSDVLYSSSASPPEARAAHTAMPGATLPLLVQVGTIAAAGEEGPPTAIKILDSLGTHANDNAVTPAPPQIGATHLGLTFVLAISGLGMTPVPVYPAPIVTPPSPPPSSSAGIVKTKEIHAHAHVRDIESSRALTGTSHQLRLRNLCRRSPSRDPLFSPPAPRLIGFPARPQSHLLQRLPRGQQAEQINTTTWVARVFGVATGFIADRARSRLRAAVPNSQHHLLANLPTGLAERRPHPPQALIAASAKHPRLAVMLANSS
ncbi:hypothetical protein K438DRAFT_1979012 [Mycena galopus ATCC 62051]|nr:hypothetical protein K438DRAFT_1979012 [Mycena galopus ATCC 62051]